MPDSVARTGRLGGLTVVCDEVADAPATSVHLWFDVGALDEPPSLAGAAHFLEHLLFKGTARRGVGVAAATIEGLGGDLNAWTSWDETCLHAVVEASAWPIALDVLVDMARNSRFDPTELEREREVVLDEIAGYDDDPDAVAGDALVAGVFGRHPYGRPILGTAATVGAMTRDAITAFWRRHYHPGRAILAVCGPHRLDEVLAEASRRITGWSAGVPRRPPTPPELPPGGLKHVVRPFAASTVQLGVPVPAVGHPDAAALEVLAAALGQGAAAELPEALELRAGVASDSWASLAQQRVAGLLDMGFHTGETGAALEVLVPLVRRVHRRGIDGERVMRAQRGLLADQLFATESVETRASDAAWYQASFGSAAAQDAHRRAVAAVTPLDVRRVAAHYLDPKRMSMVVVDAEAPSTVLHEAWRQLQAPSQPVARRPRPATERRTIAGIDTVVLADPSPVAALRVLATGGQLVEPDRQAGLARAWSLSVTRGAGPRDATAFAARADELAMWLDGHASRSLIGLSTSFPADRADGALELVGDALVDPHFDPVDVDHVAEEMLDDVATTVDRPAQVASEALWRALFAGHPWRRPSGGTEATIHRITPRALRRYHGRCIGPGGLTVAAAGGLDPEQVFDEVARWAESLTAVDPVDVPAPTGPPRRPQSRAGGTHQAAAMVAVRAPGLGHPHRLPLLLASQVLDSQSGRLFLRLREELGWAYSVWASAEVGLGAGRFSLGVTTSPERTASAAEELRAQLLALAEQGPTTEELVRVKRMVRGQLALRRQRVAGRAGDLVLAHHFHRPYDLPQVMAAVEAVQPGDVVSALRALPLDDLRVALAVPP